MLSLIRGLQQQVNGLIARGKVLLADDSNGQQRVQIAIADALPLDGCEHFQPYGFTSVPPEGAEAIVIFVGGRRDHPLVIAVGDRRTRMKGMAAGEPAMYTDEGDYIIIRRGGAIEIKGAASVTITSPNAKLTGNFEIDGDVDIKGNVNIEGASGITVPNGNVVASGINLDHHTHSGVTSGGSQTGPPL